MKDVTRTLKVAVGTVNGREVMEPGMSAAQMERTYKNCGIEVTNVHTAEMVYACSLEDFLTVAQPRQPREKKTTE